MAMINRAAFAKQMVPGLNKIFGDTYKEHDKQHTLIFTVETSDQAFEEDVMVQGFGAAVVKSEGASTSFDRMKELWTSRYDHETISLGFIITREAMDDGKYGKLSRRGTKALARSCADTRETKGANILNRGFNSTYKGGDQKELFATDHPLGGGGTWANEPSTAADLNETSLEEALIAISEWTDERGLKVKLRGMRLIVPPSLVFTAERLLKSDMRTGTGDNDVNAIKSTGMLPQGWSVNNWLTDPDAWFIKTDCDQGLIHFNRVGLETKSEPGFDNDVMKYKTYERYSFGWSDPRGAYGTPGAA